MRKTRKERMMLCLHFSERRMSQGSFSRSAARCAACRTVVRRVSQHGAFSEEARFDGNFRAETRKMQNSRVLIIKRLQIRRFELFTPAQRGSSILTFLHTVFRCPQLQLRIEHLPISLHIKDFKSCCTIHRSRCHRLWHTEVWGRQKWPLNTKKT